MASKETKSSFIPRNRNFYFHHFGLINEKNLLYCRPPRWCYRAQCGTQSNASGGSPSDVPKITGRVNALNFKATKLVPNRPASQISSSRQSTTPHRPSPNTSGALTRPINQSIPPVRLIVSSQRKQNTIGRYRCFHFHKMNQIPTKPHRVDNLNPPPTSSKFKTSIPSRINDQIGLSRYLSAILKLSTVLKSQLEPLKLSKIHKLSPYLS